MPDIVGKLFEFLLKDPRGRVGLLVYVVLCVGVFLVYEFAPDQPPLKPVEIAGMALVNLVVVYAGILVWDHWAKRRGGRHD